ncbi:MAG: glycosyl transferase, partial [Gammaproteobacteria bacterium]|nr:glycosyl transferase [Gammaproteobacteria bacterium]
MTKRVAIYVQHLLGAGHLVRAMSLAESLSRSGHQVLLLSGGFPIERAVDGYQYFQLPPTRAIEGSFSRLVDKYGKAVDESWRKSRRLMLMAEVARFEPDLVITETFPFGRRQFRFELEPLINWVKKQPSVRLMAS